MQGKDLIAGGVLLIALLMLITINELQHDWILPALLVVIPSAFLIGVWLFRLPHKQVDPRKSKTKCHGYIS